MDEAVSWATEALWSVVDQISVERVEMPTRDQTEGCSSRFGRGSIDSAFPKTRFKQGRDKSKQDWVVVCVTSGRE